MCAATTGRSAALETSNATLAYGPESVWSTATGQFTYIRQTSNTLSGPRTTQRPAEITSSREAAQAVTTQVTAGGAISFAFSATTFDELVFANVLQADWGSTLTIDGSGGDITLTNSSGMVTLSSSNASKFSGLIAKQWIRTLGFTNPTNNTWWYIDNRGSSPDTVLSLIGPNTATAITETPSGSAAKIRGSTIRNGTTFKSYFVEEQLDTSVFFKYPGAYASRATLTGGLGAFTTGTVDLVAQQETTATTTSSSGAILAAPTGRVIDPIGGFVGAYWNGAALGTGIEQFALTLENTGAASEFAMGSASAQGILGGTFTASGTMRCYFKDSTLYSNIASETSAPLSFIVKDSAGVSYAFTFLDARLNGRVAIGGPGQAISVDYTIEGGPTSNGTFVIDRMAAS